MKKRITLLIAFFLTGCMLAMAQQTVLKGVVKDSNGATIPGVTVTVKGSTVSTATNANGAFNLTAPANATLIFTSIGFTTQEVAAGGRSEINVTLADDKQQLSEVVVIGYGTAQKKDVTGAISSVKATQLESENPQSLSDILRGNVSGMTVGFSPSAKGGGDLLVRGKASLTASTSPLIVLDGVIYYGQISDINPNDIESVDVLKDASSLAVYGSKAASGVVAVTTKKGKSGTPTVNLNTNYGIATLSKDQPVYDGAGFLNWRADVARSGATTPYYIYSDPNNLPAGVTLTMWLNGQTTTNPTDLWLSRLGLVANEKANYLAGKETNWYDDIFRTGQRQDHTVSLSGRKEEVQYYMSLGYLKNENLIEGGQFSTFRSRINLEGKAAKFLTVGLNLQYADRDEGALEAAWGQVVDLSPWGDKYMADGTTLRRIPTDDNGLNARNPFLDMTYNQRMRRQNTLFGSLYGKVALPFGITFQSNFTPGVDMFRNFDFASGKNPNVTIVGGFATRAQETRYQWQVDNLLKWNKTFAEIHQFDVTLLANAEKYQSWWTSVYNEGFSPSDELAYHKIAVGNKVSANSDDKVYTADALMARLNYSLMGRYFVTGSIRRDGYSAFGVSNKRATFPAGALAWAFTEESFLKTAKWLNYGKLRVSYGENGNSRVFEGDPAVLNPYTALSYLDASKYQSVNSSGAAAEVNSIIINNRLGNANQKWEKTTSLNIGLDFAVLGNRLTGSIETYDRRTSDLLIKQTLSNVSGYGDVISNLARVSNKGFDISMNSRNLETKNLRWNTSVNVSINRNKIIQLASPNNDPGNGWFIGKDIDVVWEYKILGVWQESEVAEMNKFNKGIKPGDYKLLDFDGNYVYNDVDKQFLGYRNPRFTIGLRNEFNIYKNFDFSFQLLSNWGQIAQDNQGKNQPGSVGFIRSSSYVVPYWTPENPIDDYARLNSGLSGTAFNVYRKSSFIRLNTVALSYNIPKSVVSRARLQNARIYLNAQNAAIYAPDWNQWDPQNNGPTPRYFTVGLNVNL